MIPPPFQVDQLDEEEKLATEDAHQEIIDGSSLDLLDSVFDHFITAPGVGRHISACLKALRSPEITFSTKGFKYRRFEITYFATVEIAAYRCTPTLSVRLYGDVFPRPLFPVDHPRGLIQASAYLQQRLSVVSKFHAESTQKTPIVFYCPEPEKIELVSSNDDFRVCITFEGAEPDLDRAYCN